MDWLSQHARPIVDSLLYSVLGTLVLLGAFILGVSLIISSAIRG